MERETCSVSRAFKWSFALTSAICFKASLPDEAVCAGGVLMAAEPERPEMTTLLN